MELKLFCPCGTKYKFDVEPVNERMPWPVSCPSCGREGTADANEILRQTFASTNPAAPAAAPVQAQAPSQVAAAAAEGLRINRPTPAAAPAASAPAPLPISAPRPLPSTRPAPASRSGGGWKKAVSIVLTLLLLAAAGYRWYRRVKRLAHAVDGVSLAEDDSSSPHRNWNLHADNSVVLMVPHTNHQEVASECLALWKDKFHETFNVKKPGGSDDAGDFIVNAPFHGYVVIDGARDWKEPEFEATAQRLSEKFNGMVFLERDISFTGDWIFGVYDHGTNVFHARADTAISNNDAVQVVKVEHEDWALTHGFRPGSKGFKEFNIGDADNLTKACGMKIWDAPGESKDYLIIINAKQPR